jgi:ribonuclease HII
MSVGIDESGRGCVIGPMVVAVVAADANDRKWFWEHNVRDSKIVPPRQRDELAKKIRERCWFCLRVVEAPAIDDAVFDRTINLNGLELRLMSDLLREFRDEFPEHGAVALVDAPSINAQGYLEKLYEASGWDSMENILAKHRADKSDRTVAAASILAKSERERLIAKLKAELGVDFGCGYAHDDATRSFLRTCPKAAPYVRWSWATAKQRMQK